MRKNLKKELSKPLSLLMNPLELLDLGKTSKVANETSHQSNNGRQMINNSYLSLVIYTKWVTIGLLTI